MNKFAAVLSGVFAAVVMLSAGDASAQGRVDRREQRQENRINAGVQQGQLTRAETARLQAGQAHVQRVENRAERDGVVTGREAAHLERAQDRQSGRIYRARHNGRTPR